MSRLKIIKKKIIGVPTVFNPEDMSRKDYMDYEKFCKEYWNGKVSNENYYVLRMNEEQKALYEEERQRLLQLWIDCGHPAFWELQLQRWKQESIQLKKSKEEQENQRHAIVHVLSSWYDD